MRVLDIHFQTLRKMTDVEPQREKTGHRSRLKAWNFGFKKKRNGTILVAKTKALISFAVTAKLICAFLYAKAKIWFSHAAAQLLIAFFPQQFIESCVQDWTV